MYNCANMLIWKSGILFEIDNCRTSITLSLFDWDYSRRGKHPCLISTIPLIEMINIPTETCRKINFCSITRCHKREVLMSSSKSSLSFSPAGFLDLKFRDPIILSLTYVSRLSTYIFHHLIFFWKTWMTILEIFRKNS